MARKKANTKRYRGSAVLRLDRDEDEKTWKKGKKAEAKARTKKEMRMSATFQPRRKY